MKPINQYIDHTLLKPTATEIDIHQLCTDAIQYQFASVCVHGMYVKTAAEDLSNTGIAVAAVVGFPLGAQSSKAKLKETAIALEDGASEIDMVLPIGALKGGEQAYVLEELQLLRALDPDYSLKVILETAYLTNEEIVTACEHAIAAGANFVKTSTGFGPGGATPEAVHIMIQTVDGQAQVKASGGIRDLATMRTYLDLGATRIGTSSGVAILTEWQNQA